MTTDTAETSVSVPSVGAASHQPDEWRQINWALSLTLFDQERGSQV